jgi:hypothetical protein
MMDINELAALMLEHGLVIRGIPYEITYHIEMRHKDQYDNNEKYSEVVVCRPDGYNREMLRVTEKNSQGGKFIIAKKRTQGSTVQGWEWHKDSKKKVIFYDTIEEAVRSFIE